MPSSSRIPVFVLTGFLGSGKTTLLNRLMRRRPGWPARLAIIVNELGDVGIDGDLLPPSMTRQVELPGGCICCLLNEDLDRTLLDLVGATPDLDAIVIETTGVAEPLPIAWSLEREPLSLAVRLAAVVTVVDTVHFEDSRPLGPAVDAQVAYADILVMSKLDLAGGDVPPELDALLHELNPEASRIAGTPDAIVESLWKSLADPALPESAPASQRHDPAPASDRDHGHDHDRGHAPAGHGFDSVWLPIDNVLDLEELTEHLEGLPGNYVRIKGIALAVDPSAGSSEPMWIAFHRVGSRVSSEPVAPSAQARIVAVGPGVEQAPLAACLKAAVVPCES